MGRFDIDNGEKLSTKSQKEFEAFEKLSKLKPKELDKLGAGLDEAIEFFENKIETDKKTARENALKGGFDKSTRKANAKGGFMGTVSMKTLLTVGEGGKREHVTRKKKNNVFDVGFDF